MVVVEAEQVVVVVVEEVDDKGLDDFACFPFDYRICLVFYYEIHIGLHFQIVLFYFIYLFCLLYYIRYNDYRVTCTSLLILIISMIPLTLLLTIIRLFIYKCIIIVHDK